MVLWRDPALWLEPAERDRMPEGGNRVIKFTAKKPDGSTLVGLGLSRANCERLLAGQPIVVEAISLGLPWNGTIALFAGETEAALVRDFDRLGLIDRDTKVIGERPQ